MKDLNKIKNRLKNFKTLSEKEKYLEFQFCLLTPQSNAQRCWQAVLELQKLKNHSLEEITLVLSTKTRFHNTKAKRILLAKETWKEIYPLLSQKDIVNLRNTISEKVNGYGLKEASHFLRNIGLSNNQIAILDRHILKNLEKEKLIPNQDIKSKKHYLEIEKIFLEHAKSKNISADELDLLWWSAQNGEIFK